MTGGSEVLSFSTSLNSDNVFKASLLEVWGLLNFFFVLESLPADLDFVTLSGGGGVGALGDIGRLTVVVRSTTVGFVTLGVMGLFFELFAGILELLLFFRQGLITKVVWPISSFRCLFFLFYD